MAKSRHALTALASTLNRRPWCGTHRAGDGHARRGRGHHHGLPGNHDWDDLHSHANCGLYGALDRSQRLHDRRRRSHGQRERRRRAQWDGGGIITCAGATMNIRNLNIGTGPWARLQICATAASSCTGSGSTTPAAVSTTSLLTTSTSSGRHLRLLPDRTSHPRRRGNPWAQGHDYEHQGDGLSEERFRVPRDDDHEHLGEHGGAAASTGGVERPTACRSSASPPERWRTTRSTAAVTKPGRPGCGNCSPAASTGCFCRTPTT